MKKISVSKRINWIILSVILLLSLIALTYSLFQVNKAAPNPTLAIERYIFTPANNLINVTGSGYATINLHQTSFKNPFLKYDSVNSSIEDQEILSTQFKRSIGSPPDNIDFLQFQTVVNNTDEIVNVSYTFELEYEYPIKDRTTLVLYVYTSLEETKLSLLGKDSKGNETEITYVLDEAYEKYYLYIQPVPISLKTVQKVNLSYVCQPRGYTKINTIFRIMNLFDEKPSIDSKILQQGQWSVKIERLEFPHRFRWEQLKAINTSIWIKLNLEPESISTFNTLTYLWKIPDQLNVTINDASVIFVFSRSIEAPLTQARINIETNSTPKVIDVTGNISEAFISQSLAPRVVLSIPNNGKKGQVLIEYLYWPLLWNVIAFFCIAVIMIETTAILIYQKYVRI